MKVSSNKKFHDDRNVTSKLLNLRISYYWRRLANEDFIETFREWNTHDSTLPDYILMGWTFKLVR